MLTDTEIDQLVKKIVERIQPKKVIIFGSYAKNMATTRSDLDLFIIKETELPFATRAQDLAPILSNSLVHLDIHIYTPEEVRAYGQEEFSFVHSVLKTGRTVFEQ